jgi:hypothetical protein
MLRTLKIFESLCGSKHQESRELQDRLYKELTRKVLMRNAPSEMSLRVDKAKFALDEQIVQDAKINPCLVKKRP